jgi:hypothetical protein
MASRSEANSQQDVSIKGLEQKLSDTFKPVQPSGDFVRKLKQRLSTTPPLHLEEDYSTGWMWWILGFILSIMGFYFFKRLWRYLNTGK